MDSPRFYTEDNIEPDEMLYMVIERFKDGGAEAVYRRLDEKGRMMPDGLRYVDSWVAADVERCFQVVECDDAQLIQQWIAAWTVLIEFEVIPVVSSEEAAGMISETEEIGMDDSTENGETE